MRRSLIAAAAALAAVAVLAPSASAQELDESLTTLTRATPVAAFGQTTAWSEVDPATGQYRLAVLHGREWHTVAVTPRSVPFDVDVGPGPRGTAVTYSRCSFEPPERFGRSGLSILPDYTRGRGCKMYR